MTYAFDEENKTYIINNLTFETFTEAKDYIDNHISAEHTQSMQMRPAEAPKLKVVG